MFYIKKITMRNKTHFNKNIIIPNGRGRGQRLCNAPDDLIYWAVMHAEGSKNLDMFLSEFMRRGLTVKKN